jgi:exopolyphosphatase / guanosine-5'-triphosphate,3'-diphosphate pyrophosphatase
MLHRILPRLGGSQSERASEAPGADDGAAPETGFPIRAAAIDIGSNAMRFLATEFLHAQHYTVIEQTRTPVRLGHDVFLTGKLAADAMDAAVDAIAGYRSRIEALEIAHYRAVATSAVRDSRNGDEFLERVREQAGIELELITGAEEARLVHQAVRSRIKLGSRRWVLADLGGGSVEVSLVDDEKIFWSVSHDMGSVRLLEELAVAGDEPGRFRRRLEEYTSTLRIPSRGRKKPAGFIATGGNIEALAKLADAPVDARGVARLPLAQLRAIVETLSTLSYRQRVDELGLREDRADVVLPASMVYERLAVLSGFEEIVVPNVGLKDGVVLDLVDDVARHVPHGEQHDQVVYAGAIALGRRFRFESAHGRHVAALALSLFDQLEALHGLGRDDRRILLAAGLLHDIGTFLGYRKHHKHSLYILSQSELPGFAPDEILMVANVARYHRKSEPQSSHDAFMKLAEEDRDRVVSMAAILRIADALDREHLQNVRAVRARTTDDRLVLELDGTGELLLERWAVEKKAGLFEKTFGREVRIRTDGES